MEETDKANDIDKLFIELMQLFVSRGYNMGTIYYILGSMFCRVGQVNNISVERILADVELSFAAIPPIIEEKDESK